MGSNNNFDKEDVKRAAGKLINFLNENEIEQISDLEKFVINKAFTQKFGKEEYIAVTKSDLSPTYYVSFISPEKYKEILKIGVNISSKFTAFIVNSNEPIPGYAFSNTEKKELQTKNLFEAEINNIRLELYKLVQEFS